MPKASPPLAPATPRFAVYVAKDVEVFESVEALTDSITPEAVEQFDRIDIQARSERLETRISFVRRPVGRPRVELVVRPQGCASLEEATAAAAVIAISIRRGFRQHIGVVSASDGLAHFAGRRAPYAPILSHIAPLGIGACLSLIAIRTLRVLFPGLHLSFLVSSLGAFALGLVYVAGWWHLLPNIEITRDGRTRMRSFITRSVLAIVTLVATQVIKSTISAT